MSVQVITTRDGRRFRLITNETPISTSTTTSRNNTPKPRSKSSEYTHFLSIPIPTPFADHISRLQAPYANIFPSACIIPPESYHITLLMLSLPTPDAVDRAKSILKQASSSVYDVVGTASVSLDLTRTYVMQGSQDQARVIVMDVRPSDALKKAVRVLYDAFKRAGLVPDDVNVENIKYHVTLVNTKYYEQEYDDI